MLKQLPPGTTPPLILNYSASTVPIIQLALSGSGISEQQLADLGLNVVRTPLVTVPGAAIPYPYGGKTRQVQIDLDPQAMQSRGLSGQDVADALAAQNLIMPVGTEKIGALEYDQSQQFAVRHLRPRDLPIKTVNGAMVYIRDVAHVRDGSPPQMNIVHVDGGRSVLMTVLKDGSVSTLDIIDGVKEKVQELKAILPGRCKSSHRRSIGVRESRGLRRRPRRRHRRRADQPDDPDLPGQLALDGHHCDLHSAVDPRRDRGACPRSARRST